VMVPIDVTGPNPNDEEFDNLYLDMNGIVHPCSHPEDKPPPQDEEEMMTEIFKYTERVFNMVRPRKLLMIAVGMSHFDFYVLNIVNPFRWCRSESKDEPTTIQAFPLCERS
jgi:hypothetical protein